MALRTARDNFGDLGKILLLHDLLQVLDAFLAGDNHDFVDRFALLESRDRVRDHRLACKQREQFVKTHAPAAAGCDNNGCNHSGKKIRVSSLKVSALPG